MPASAATLDDDGLLHFAFDGEPEARLVGVEWACVAGHTVVASVAAGSAAAELGVVAGLALRIVGQGEHGEVPVKPGMSLEAVQRLLCNAQAIVRAKVPKPKPKPKLPNHYGCGCSNRPRPSSKMRPNTRTRPPRPWATPWPRRRQCKRRLPAQRPRRTPHAAFLRRRGVVVQGYVRCIRTRVF